MRLRPLLLVYAACFMLLLAGHQASAQQSGSRPNVLLILADDLGWSDTTLYGTTKFYETPNIERLGRRGMVFTNAYAANPLCSPTRSSIQTGLYPGRIGITTPSCHVPEEKFEETLVAKAAATQKALQAQSATRLKWEYITLAESLKAAGYVTAHFGKWHLGREPYDALHQGFDFDWPHVPDAPGPGGGYLAPWKFIHDPKISGAVGEHVEDRMSQEAARFIGQHKHEPFYVNYWAFSVHSPWSAKPKLVEKYKTKLAKLSPDDPQRNPLYAAMVESLDDGVGRLLDAIDENGLTDRTIIIFFSDNGGYIWNPRATDPEGYESTAVTSNAPLRGGKATLYEGGTREPCIVVWPGKTKPGSRNDAILTSIDLHPTILDMLGLKPQPGQKFDGISQTAAFLGQGAPRDTAYCFFPHYTPTTGNVPGVWVRRGDWKLIRFFFDNDDQSNRYELYNLRDDLSETKNLAATDPDKVKELDALIEQHLRDIGAVVPKPNPTYSPAAARLSDLGWNPSKDASLSAADGVLSIQSTGNDPNISTRDLPEAKGPFTLRLEMKSGSKGAAQVFWATKAEKTFFRDRSVSFQPQHDGQWHEYRMKLPVEQPLTGLRIDPSTAPGKIELRGLSLEDAPGATVKRWDFSRP